MGELSLIHGPAHPDKWTPTYQRCRERLSNGRGGTFLWLCPTYFQAQLMRRRLLAASGTGSRPGYLALDLDRFIAALHRRCPERRPPLPSSAHRLLVEDTLAASAAATPYFSRRPDGLGRGLTRLFRTLEEAGIAPDDLGADAPRSAELQTLYTGYLKRLAADWTGSAQRFAVVGEHLDRWLVDQFCPGLELMVLCNFTAVPAPFLPVLEKLLDLVPQSIALLDYDPVHPQLFARSRPLYKFLDTRAQQSEPFQPPHAQHPAAAFANRLFTRDQAEISAPIARIACPDRLGEVTQIARRIRQLHRNQGADLAQIRISFRNLAPYAPLIAEVLPRHGLPFYLSRPLAAAPCIGAVLAILDLVLERYSRPALLRLLCLPWFRLRYPYEGQSIELSADDFDAWARNLPPTTGRREWLEAIGGRCAYLERELAQADGPVSEEIDDPQAWRESLRGDLDALRPLQEGLNALFGLLRPLERRQALPVFRQHLLHALGELGLVEKLISSATADRGAEDGRALARLLELLDELCAPTAALRPRTLGQFAELLRDAIAQAHIPAPAHVGVQVTDVVAAGGAPCDYLFLGGLAQGEFPRLPPTDIFLDESQRRTLGEDESAAIAAERLLFYQALCAARRGLCVLYPQRSGTAVLSPSPFIGELDDLLADDPDTSADDPTPCTTADLHLALGRGLCATVESTRAQEALDLYRQAAGLEPYAATLRRLLRGLNIATARTNPEALSTYEGVLDAEEQLTGLRTRLGPGHAFSTTQLETYGRCPFRFFAQRLLNIAPLQDPEADESALERGNLVHRILYQFYSAHGEAAEREENLAQNAVQLRQIARQVAAEMHLEGFFWERELERLCGADADLGHEGILTRFLQLQATSANPAVPTHFELSFGSYPGMGPRDPQSTHAAYAIGDPEQGDEVRIFGKIDRVDRTADGRFVVFDYKTGREPRTAEIAQGLNLQLPLYLLAIESLLPDAGLVEGVGGAYLLLRDLEHCGQRGLFADESHRNTAYVSHGKQGLYDHEEYRQTLEAVRGFVLAYARSMRRGVFHVTRHNPANTCPGCPYAQSCRLDPRRMRSMDRTGKLP